MTVARRSVRQSAAILILALVVVFVVWTLFALLLMLRPLYPWDFAYWAGRELIRLLWATLTGQSMSRDLFPW